jgi:hypothetical protein
VPHRFEVDAIEDVQCLEKHRPLAPRAARFHPSEPDIVSSPIFDYCLDYVSRLHQVFIRFGIAISV